MNDIHSDVLDIRATMVTSTKLRIEMDEIEKKFERLHIQIEDSINKNLGLHNFVEKYVPMRV